MAEASSPPAIRVYDSRPHNGRHANPRRSPSYAVTSSSVPMAIPNAREAPPPPLPPPRYINDLSNGHDPGWQWTNNRGDAPVVGKTYGSVKSGSSSRRGGQDSSQEISVEDDGPFYFGASRRASSITTTNTVDTSTMQGDSPENSDQDRSRPSLSNHRYVQTCSDDIHSQHLATGWTFAILRSAFFCLKTIRLTITVALGFRVRDT